jgi:ribosome-associated toxin RatA of RatAB toxin-antitoxin module
VADSVSGQIRVTAQPAAVMKVIAELERYPEWAKSVRRTAVTKRFPDGRPRTARFWVANSGISDEYILDYEWDGNHRCAWRLVHGRLQNHQVGAYTLVGRGDETDVRCELTIGLRMPLPGALRRLGQQHIMGIALRDLKHRVER